MDATRDMAVERVQVRVLASDERRYGDSGHVS
jgi:hypothetical protein